MIVRDDGKILDFLKFSFFDFGRFLNIFLFLVPSYQPFGNPNLSLRLEPREGFPQHEDLSRVVILAARIGAGGSLGCEDIGVEGSIVLDGVREVEGSFPFEIEFVVGVIDVFEERRGESRYCGIAGRV